MKTLNIVRKIDFIWAFLVRDRDDAWLKKKELEVCNGLRAEADKRREAENGARL
jgi:hypothetical protein